MKLTSVARRLSVLKALLPAFFLLFGMGSDCQAQKNLDSLLIVWENPSMSDSARAGAYADYIYAAYLFSNPDSAAVLADELLQFSEKRNHLTGVGRAYYLLGLSEYNLGKYGSAMDLLQKSLGVLEKSGPLNVLTSPLNSLGILYTEFADFDKAIEYHLRTLKIQEEIGNANGIGGSLNNIGLIYYDLEDFDTALKYFKRSVAVRDSAGLRRGMAMPLNNIGGIFVDRLMYDSALVYFEKSYEIAEEIGDMNAIPMSLLNLGLCHNNLGNLDKAIEYYSEGLSISESIKDKVKIATSLVNLSNVYMKKGEMTKAVDYNKRSVALAQEVGAVYLIQSAAEALYLKLKQTGDYRGALESYELSLMMRDSMANQENSRKVMMQQFQYEADKKEALLRAEQEKKDALASAELQRKNQQRNLSMAGFALMAVASGVFLIQRNKIRKERNKSDSLLLNILPAEVAAELKDKGKADARHYDEVTVIFTDFQAFTRISEQLTATELVETINECFSAFDRIVEKHGIEKIKTIGDSYMAAGGLPAPSNDHAVQVVSAALEMQAYMKSFSDKQRADGKTPFELRIGVHTGPVVAGIVGTRKFQFDIWGDTVNTASRMESASESGEVNISHNTWLLVNSVFETRYRGEVEAKNKGKLRMYFVTGSKIS